MRQNHLESSTVNVVSEMVDLIRVMRSFEANQKSVHAHDEALQASIYEGGCGRITESLTASRHPSRTVPTWRKLRRPDGSTASTRTTRSPETLRPAPPSARRHGGMMGR